MRKRCCKQAFAYSNLRDLAHQRSSHRCFYQPPWSCYSISSVAVSLYKSIKLKVKCLLACSWNLRKSARCLFKLSIPCLVPSRFISIDQFFLHYICINDCLDIVLCKSKRTAATRPCEVTFYDTVSEVPCGRKSARLEVLKDLHINLFLWYIKMIISLIKDIWDIWR